MLLPVLPLLVSAPLVFSVADNVPRFDLDETCKRAAESAVAPGRNSEGCKNDENTALETLNRQWAGFAPADRTRCTRASSMGGPASYVELLTCLEMAKTVRTLPKDGYQPQPALR